MSIKYVGEDALGRVIAKVKQALGGKVDAVSGKGLSTNDFTTALKTKLDGIASGAQVNALEKVKVNGTALTISSTDKSVNINLSDASVNYATSAGSASSATSATNATNAANLVDNSYSYTPTSLHTALENITAIAQGKTETYAAEAGASNLNFTNTQDNAVSYTFASANASFTDTAGNAIKYSDLKIGDVILLTNTDYPDRWVSNIQLTSSPYSLVITFTALESRKMDLSAYAKKADLAYTASGMGAGKTIATLTQSNGKIAATFQDISITKSQISDFPSIPQGTVTSVRVQATSPVVSSVNTAQGSTLDTTISLADGYGDTKSPYAAKNANYVLCGPSSGSPSSPSFRKLTSYDIPTLAISKIDNLQTALNAKCATSDLVAMTTSEVDTLWTNTSAAS